MEEAESEQELSPGARLVAAHEEIGVRDRVIEIGSEEVGTQAFWRLIGHLHTCMYVCMQLHSESGTASLISSCQPNVVHPPPGPRFLLL